MDNIKKSKSKVNGVGRPAYSEDQRAKPVSIRLNRSQREKLKVLGGVEWIRNQIDHELNK